MSDYITEFSFLGELSL